jgi:hypothetical protein
MLAVSCRGNRCVAEKSLRREPDARP